MPIPFRCAPPRLPLALPLFFLVGPAAAQSVAPGVSGSSIAQGLFGLLLIIGLLVGAAYLLRRLGGSTAPGQAGPIRVIAGLAVGTRERILLLEIEDSWIVVGVTATQMRTLHTLPKGSLPEGGHKAGGVPFASWLKQFAERKNNDR